MAVDLGARSYRTSIAYGREGRVRQPAFQDDVFSYGSAERPIVSIHEPRAVQHSFQALRDDALNLGDEPPLEVLQGP